MEVREVSDEEEEEDSSSAEDTTDALGFEGGHVCAGLPEAAVPAGGAPECRICKCADAELISPCACRGSCEWVHHDCLLRWLKRRHALAAPPSPPGGDGAPQYRCEICRSALEVEIEHVAEGWLYFNRRSVSPVAPSLLVAYLSVAASFVMYIVCMLLESCVLPLVAAAAPSLNIHPREHAPVCASLLLVVLKAAILIAPYAPTAFADVLRQYVTAPLEHAALMVWPYPSIALVAGLFLSLHSMRLVLPPGVSPFAEHLRTASLALSVIAMAILIRMVFYTGLPTLTGVKGTVLPAQGGGEVAAGGEGHPLATTQQPETAPVRTPAATAARDASAPDEGGGIADAVIVPSPAGPQPRGRQRAAAAGPKTQAHYGIRNPRGVFRPFRGEGAVDAVR